MELSRTKSVPAAVQSGGFGGWWGSVRESFAGAWQKNIECDTRENIMAFSAVFSCVSRIADDIGKLCLEIVERDGDGIWSPVETSPFSAALEEPNSYQTLPQFLSYWIITKLMYGNAYILKEFDGRGVVIAMHVLDPRRVKVLVAPDGSVLYDMRRDDLAGAAEGLVAPQRFVMHDRMNTIWHPLIGVSPIYACGASATQGIRIQNNSARFFENMSRPSGMLTAPATIDNVTAARMKGDFESTFGGVNIGRLFVAGDGLSYSAMTMPAVDAQLIEQLKWTVEDVARCFHVPLYKLGAGQPPTFTNMGSMNQDYYQQTLQPLIEAAEWLLEDGLNLRNVAGKSYSVRFDLAGLLRMDPQGQMTMLKDGVSAGVMAPNEARKTINLKPVDGGNSPYLQVQNYSLDDLDKRSDAPKPVDPAPVLPTEPKPVDPAAKAIAYRADLLKELDLAHA